MVVDLTKDDSNSKDNAVELEEVGIVFCFLTMIKELFMSTCKLSSMCRCFICRLTQYAVCVLMTIVHLNCVMMQITTLIMMCSTHISPRYNSIEFSNTKQ